MPVTPQLFGFVGLGAGLAYTEGPGAALALVPRAGINVAIGRSGVLTPALQLLWSTNADDTEIGVGMNVGFSAMW